MRGQHLRGPKCIMRCIVGFAFAGLSMSAAVADTEPSIGIFSLQLENDHITATDLHYTHDTRLFWVSGAELGP